MTRPISDLNVPLTRLQADLRQLVARQRLAARLGRARWLVAHPDWPTGHASVGEQAEYRHALDTDVDRVFAQMACDHPDKCTCDDGSTP